MNKNIRKISVSKLTPGMMLAKEINKNGVKLLDRGVILTSSYIDRIRAIDPILQVIVYENEKEHKEINEFIHKSVEKLYEKERAFHKLSLKLDEIYNKMEHNSQITLAELREFQRDMLLESENHGVTMRSIVNKRNIQEYLYRHSINVGILSNMLGKWVGLDNQELTRLTYAGILHDIGKIRINDAILNKKGKLSSQEFGVIKTHAVIGYEIIKQIPYMHETVSMGVLMHHERCDGTGYPLKFKDSRIHTYGKIIAIADEFDAITSNRVYRAKESPFEAFKIMKEEALSKLDYNYWCIFLKGMMNCYIGEMVRLNNGDIGKIINMDEHNITKPLLLVDDKFVDLREKHDIFIEDII